MCKPSVISGCLVALVLAGAVQAQDNPFVRMVGDWRIGVDPDSSGCFTTRHFDKGLTLWLAVRPETGGLALILAHRDWDAIEAGARYDLSLTFDQRNTWTLPFTGTVDASGQGHLLAETDNPEDAQTFVAPFAQAASVTLMYDGADLGQFSLAGSLRALQALGTCQIEVAKLRAAPEPKPAPSQQLTRDDVREARLAEAYTAWDRARELYDAGHHGEAIELAQAVIDALEVDLGPGHRDTLAVKMNLAVLLNRTGRAAEAEPLFRQVLAGQEAHPDIGPDHPDTLTARMNLAILLDSTGRAADAEPLYRQVLAGQESNPAIGPDHPETVATRMNLAALLYRTGRAAEAEPLYRQVLAGQESHPAIGPDHPDTLRTRMNLALLLDVTGRAAEAESLYRQVLVAQESNPAIGPGHPSTLGTRMNLANLLGSTGRAAEAEPLFREVLAAQEAHPAAGPDHPDTLHTRMNLAILLSRTGRTAEAEPLYRQVLAARQSNPAVGPDHPDTLTARMNLAVLLAGTGRTAEAEPLYRQVLAARQSNPAIGPDHPGTLLTRMNLAILLSRTGRAAEAEPHFRTALVAQEDHPAIGPDHHSTLRTRVNLANLLDSTGRAAEAEPLYREALARQLTALGAGHPDVQSTRLNLGILLHETGRSEEALVPLRAAYAVRAQRMGSAAGAATAETRDALRAETARTAYDLAMAAWAVAQDGGAEGADPAALRDEAFAALQSRGTGGAAEALARAAARAAAADPALRDAVAAWEEAGRQQQWIDAQVVDLASRNDLDDASRTAWRTRLDRQRLEAGDQLRRSLARIGEIDPGILQMIAPDPVSPDELRTDLLSENEALVMLVPPTVGAPGFVFAISQDATEWARIEMSEAELGNEIARLRELIRDPTTRPVPPNPAVSVDKDDWPQQVAALSADRANVSEQESTAETGFDRQAAFELYQELLGDPAIQKVTSGKQLIIAPQGMLLSLPFAILVTEPPTGDNDDPAALRATRWLGIETALTTLPAPSNLRSLRRQGTPEIAAADRLPLVAIADPVFNARPAGECAFNRAEVVPDLPEADTVFEGALAVASRLAALTQLPCTRTEALTMIETLWKNEPAARAAGALLLGEDATETAVAKSSAIPRARTILLATHGLLGGRYQNGKLSEPGLALTIPKEPVEIDSVGDAPSLEAAARAGARIDDGLLTASEITRLRLNADLVILSACDTAAAGRDGGEGLTGLASAFLYAGARALMVSHWPVRDDLAAKITTDTIARMDANGLSRAEALRLSMKALLDDKSQDHTNRSNAHPNAWAPFLLVGNRG